MYCQLTARQRASEKGVMFVKSRFSQVHCETKKTELTLQSQKRCVSVSGEIYTWELLTIRYWWGGVLFFSLDQKK